MDKEVKIYLSFIEFFRVEELLKKVDGQLDGCQIPLDIIGNNFKYILETGNTLLKKQQ